MLKRIWFKKDYDTFFVTWSLHNLCNFRCEYCPPNLNNGTTENVSLEDVKNFFFSLKQHVPNKKIIFAFSGGEPTIHPEFINIVKFLTEQECEVSMTSNGSRPLKWWKEAEPYIDHLVISYHPSWTKQQKLYDVINFLTETTWINLDLMMHPLYWDETVKFGETLKGKNNLSIAYLPIQQDFGVASKGLISYTEDQLDFLQSPPTYWGPFLPSNLKLEKCRGQFGRGFKYMETSNGISQLDYKYLIANELTNFKGYECDLGQEGLIIEINGDIYNAYCHTGGIIGNIRDKNLNLKPQSVICDKNICACSVDIEISKRIKSD